MVDQDLPTEAEYEALIDRYIEARGPDRDAVADEIERVFSVTTTILVLDLSGFSRLTARFGVIHYLAMVRRMRLLTNSLIGGHGGEVIKFEADNLFARFDRVDQAMQFAMDMLKGFGGMNVMTEDASDIHAAIGIAAGPVLLIEGRDAWGEAMNLASKLGEDLANPGEILVHEDAFQSSARPDIYKTEEVSLSVSGIRIKARRVIGFDLGG